MSIVKVKISYKDDAESWNNLSRNLITFLIESDELRKLLCRE